jgi:hypothetical protein
MNALSPLSFDPPSQGVVYWLARLSVLEKGPFVLFFASFSLTFSLLAQLVSSPTSSLPSNCGEVKHCKDHVLSRLVTRRLRILDY